MCVRACICIRVHSCAVRKNLTSASFCTEGERDEMAGKLDEVRKMLPSATEKTESQKLQEAEVELAVSLHVSRQASETL